MKLYDYWQCFRTHVGSLLFSWQLKFEVETVDILKKDKSMAEMLKYNLLFGFGENAWGGVMFQLFSV